MFSVLAAFFFSPKSRPPDGNRCLFVAQACCVTNPPLRFLVEVVPGRHSYGKAVFKVRLINSSDDPLQVIRGFDLDFGMGLRTTSQAGQEIYLYKRTVEAPPIFPRDFGSLSAKCGIVRTLEWASVFRDVKKPTDILLQAQYGCGDPRSAPENLDPSLLGPIWSNTILIRLRAGSVEFR